MTKKLNRELSDIERRLTQANRTLAVELLRRGIGPHAPAATREQRPKLDGVLLAAELANADRQLAARAVLRGLLSREELKALDIMLKFQPRRARAGKLDELIRIVERAIEGEQYGDRS